MSRESRVQAGVICVLFPTVVYGGAALLNMIVGADEGYLDNEVRQDLWRAGHAHAGVLLILSLVVLRYIDEAALPAGLKRTVRFTTPAAAVLLPVAFFLSVASPAATEPNNLIYLAYLGAVILALGLLALGVGLLRTPRNEG